jgi:N-methylhydantoinase A/oxoprolinase/acetone carboxylase beta subunit
MLATDCIRYSTTQGTNALVERKGPRLGLICLGSLRVQDLMREATARDLFTELLGERVVSLDTSVQDTVLDRAATQAVNQLAAAGATRIIVSGSGSNCQAAERKIKALLLKKFPPHLLGALPMLYAHELVADDDVARRTWTAIFNAFLHPSMERFLYSAEHRMRQHKIQNALLIFRNDGGASRVARTSAVKTYSSGPRGGAEALRALAAHYDFANLVGIDVGGTTTDIALVERGSVRTDRFGAIEGVISSLPLCNIVSVGVGGSSIIRVADGAIQVGPQSVGSAPGPACFGFGGTQATITDVLLVMGLLDSSTYFAGELALSVSAAREVIEKIVAGPLDMSVERACSEMQSAWVRKISNSLSHAVALSSDTTLAAFGGAGPLLATRIADSVGIRRILIPGLAAVFSAFGVGFSDISHESEQVLPLAGPDEVAKAYAELLQRTRSAMFAEGIDLAECKLDVQLLTDTGSVVLRTPEIPHATPAMRNATLVMRATKAMPHARLTGGFGKKRASIRDHSPTRRIFLGKDWRDLPLLRLSDEVGGIAGAGPIVLEEEFFTALVDPGWHFERDPAGDIVLTRQQGDTQK